MLARLLLHWLSFAAAPTVELTWSAGPECPSAQAVRQAIVERLDARGFEGNVRVDAVVRESELGWVASITVEEAVRSIELQSCADAPRSVAVVVAIATTVTPPTTAEPALPPAVPPAPVEPLVTPVPLERPSDPSPAELRPAEAGSVSDSPPPPRPSRRQPGRVGLALGAEGLIAHGALPGAAGAVAGDVGHLWRRAFMQVGGLHRFQREHRASADPPRGGAFRLTAGRVAAGPRYPIRRLELAAAGGAELGAIWARGVGVSTPLPRRRLWAAVSLGGRVGARVTEWLAIAASVEGAVPVLRPSFSLGGRVRVAQVGPALLRAGLRIEFRPSLRQKNLRTSGAGGQ